MLRALSVLIVLSTPAVVSAQLMVDRHPLGNSSAKIRVAAAVPKALTGNASLRFEILDICFDGGSHGAFFKRDNDFPFFGLYVALIDEIVNGAGNEELINFL